MNRGEGLRIAARAKHGTVGLFQEEKKPKKKQFSYKSRTQSYPVRKAQTNADSKDIHQQQNTKTNSQKSISSGKLQKETQGGQRNRSVNKPVGNKQKKPAADYVKKNKTTPGVTNTITLTQEQLNAILQSIGAAGTSTGSSAPVIAIENGTVKMENDSGVGSKEGDEQEKDRDDDVCENKEKKTKVERKEQKESSKKETNDENILDMLNHHENDNNQSEVSSKSASLAADSRDRKIESLPGDTAQKKDFTWGNSVGMGNIGAIVGSQPSSGLTLQEKKRQEWKKALDEQLAEQTKRKEHEDMLRRSVDDNGMYPHRQRTQAPEAVKNMPSTNKYKNPANDVVVPASSLGQVSQQSYVPAAMRSNFFIGGSAGQRTDDYNALLKRREQQEWIAEIERQKREAAERKNVERRQNMTEKPWPDPQPSRPLEKQDKPQDNIHNKQTKRDEPPFTVSSHSTDIISPREIGDLSTPRGGALTDPAELERRERAKQKHVEHMRAIQEQVEEKQRKKREADKLRRQEEAEEERKLVQEREALQTQFDMEKQKQRNKEEVAAAKQKVLEESILNAQHEALAAKHAKRVQKLNKHGHDTTNLRTSWDANDVRESPPSQMVHSSRKHHPVQHLPPSPPLVEATRGIPLDSERVTSKGSPGGRRDVGTLTMSEQSTQTEYSHREAISPRLLETIRQASAGIEYKTRRKDQEPEINTETNKKTNKLERTGEKQKERKAEKPKWGQNIRKKKMSNSDKDLSKVGKGREERRQRRQEELLAQQERLTRRRDSLKKRAPSGQEELLAQQERLMRRDSLKRAPSGVGSINDVHPETASSGERGAKDLDRVRGVEESRDTMGESPATMDGDFYPFLRSEDVKLNKRSVTVTPVTREESFQNQETYLDTNTYSPPHQMDPLLNPERLKDSSQRQERILEQLSHLRQGLMMKQREVELGLSPTMTHQY